MTNKDLQNTQQKTKDWATQTPLETGMKWGVRHVSLVTSILRFYIKYTTWCFFVYFTSETERNKSVLYNNLSQSRPIHVIATFCLFVEKPSQYNNHNNTNHGSIKPQNSTEIRLAFDFERTWWRLFKKHVMRTKFDTFSRLRFFWFWNLKIIFFLDHYIRNLNQPFQSP